RGRRAAAGDRRAGGCAAVSAIRADRLLFHPANQPAAAAGSVIMMTGSLSLDRRRVTRAVLIALLVGAGLGSLLPGLLAPGKAEDEGKTESTVGPPSRLTTKNGVAVLTLSASEQRNGGFETARLSPPTAQEWVTGYGTVLDAAP